MASSLSNQLSSMVLLVRSGYERGQTAADSSSSPQPPTAAVSALRRFGCAIVPLGGADSAGEGVWVLAGLRLVHAFLDADNDDDDDEARREAVQLGALVFRPSQGVVDRGGGAPAETAVDTSLGTPADDGTRLFAVELRRVEHAARCWILEALVRTPVPAALLVGGEDRGAALAALNLAPDAPSVRVILPLDFWPVDDLALMELLWKLVGHLREHGPFEFYAVGMRQAWKADWATSKSEGEAPGLDLFMENAVDTLRTEKNGEVGASNSSEAGSSSTMSIQSASALRARLQRERDAIMFGRKAIDYCRIPELVEMTQPHDSQAAYTRLFQTGSRTAAVQLPPVGEETFPLDRPDVTIQQVHAFFMKLREEDNGSEKGKEEMAQIVEEWKLPRLGSVEVDSTAVDTSELCKKIDELTDAIRDFRRALRDLAAFRASVYRRWLNWAWFGALETGVCQGWRPYDRRKDAKNRLRRKARRLRGVLAPLTAAPAYQATVVLLPVDCGVHVTGSGDGRGGSPRADDATPSTTAVLGAGGRLPKLLGCPSVMVPVGGVVDAAADGEEDEEKGKRFYDLAVEVVGAPGSDLKILQIVKLVMEFSGRAT